MRNPRKIAFNTSLIALCRIGSLLVESIAFVIIARHLRKSGLGNALVDSLVLKFGCGNGNRCSLGGNRR